MLQIRKRWPLFVVLAAVFLWSAGIMALAVWKYQHFLYNAIDLAYFNQVFWNTVRGNLFGLTIHPHLSLGDHAEFFILLLAPLYALYQHPLTLVALQTLAIASAAIPLFLLFKKRYGDLVGVGVALAYLFNPFIQQAALFEFHILPFFWPLFLWAFYFTHPQPLPSREGNQKNSSPLRGEDRGGGESSPYLPYLLIALILLVREDVALLVAAWGVMVLLSKRGQSPLSGDSPHYGWFLLLGGLGIFIFDQLVIGHFQPTGSYKFLAYYGHLGQSWGEIIKNSFLHPGLVLSSLFHLDRFELLLGLLGPFLFLPALSWRFWILAAFPLLEFGLQTIDSRIVLQSHYQFLFLPAIIVGLWDKLPRRFHATKHGSGLAMTSAIFLFLTIGLFAVYNPVGDFLRLRQKPQFDEQLLKRALQQIPKDAGVVANYRLLSHLSSRRTVLATHYAHLGRQQYSRLPYDIPAEASYIVFDLNDIWEYLFQYGRGGWGKEALDKALQEWRTKLDSQGFKLVWAVENMQVWKRGGTIDPSLRLRGGEGELRKKFGPLTLVGYKIAPASWGSDGVIAVRLLWQAKGEVPANTFVRFKTLTKDGQVIADQLFPLSQNVLAENTFWLEQPFRQVGAPLADRLLVLEVGTREIYLGMNFLGSGEVSTRHQDSWGEFVLGGLPLTGR